MEPGGYRLALEWDRNRFDLVVGEPGVVGKTLALLLVKLDVLLARIIVRPLCGTIVNGSHVPIIARRNGIALVLGLARLRLAASRGAFKGRANISQLLHADADCR